MIETAKPICLSFQSQIISSFVLGSAELLIGTDPLFAALMSSYNFIFWSVVRQLGGITTVNGMIVLFMGLTNVLFSQVMKVVLGQPAQTFLDAPTETAVVQNLGIASFYLGARFAESLPIGKAWFPGSPTAEQMHRGGLICLIISVVIQGVSELLPDMLKVAAIGGVLGYLGAVSSIGIIFTVAAKVDGTKGDKIASPVLAILLILNVLPAIYGVSKQGLIQPILAILLAAIAFGYRFTRTKAIFSVALIVASFAPFQNFSKLGHGFFVGRYPNQGMIQAISSFWQESQANGGFSEFIRKLTDHQENETQKQFGEYYGKSYGVLDRFSMIAPGSTLVAKILEVGPVGYDQFWGGFTLLPKSITGIAAENATRQGFGHLVGYLGEEDLTTGISFGLFPDAFGIGSFTGVLLIGIAYSAIMFVICKKMCSTLRSNIYGLSLFVSTTHVVNEASTSFIGFFAFRVAPFTIMLFMGLRGLMNIGMKNGPTKNRTWN